MNTTTRPASGGETTMRLGSIFVLLLAAAIGCAHARAAPPALTVHAPARASARLGAVRLDLALRNTSSRTVQADADPARLRVAVREGSGGEVACDPPVTRGGPLSEIAPGASVAVVLDLGARCRIVPGEYAVDVAYDGPGGPAAPASLVLRVTRWVNPGILSPRPDAGRSE
jgi:hypothetical protein